MSRSTKTIESEVQLDAYQTGLKATMYMLTRGLSWSGYERNCTFLNCGTERWANVSAATGLDFADDGRALALVDWDHDGDLDMWLRNRTGPRLRLMRNLTDTTDGGRTSVALRLEGTKCNRDAIGARVEVHVNGPIPTKLVQTLYAGDGYLSQSSKWMHFGLGRNPQIERVIVRWPGTKAQTYRGVLPGRRYRLVEGDRKPSEVTPGRSDLRLTSSAQPTATIEKTVRAVLPTRVSMPQLSYQTFDGMPQSIESTENIGPLLVNIWASWCPSCIVELRSWTAEASRLRAAGLNILTLSVDGLGPSPVTKPSDAERKLANLRFPFDAGFASPELLDKLDVVQEMLFSRVPPLEIPLSLLLDQQGRIAVMYRGAVEVETLLDDVRHLTDEPQQWRPNATRLAGKWLGRPDTSELTMAITAAETFLDHEYTDDAARYVATSHRYLKDHSRNLRPKQLARLNRDVSNVHVLLARALSSDGDLGEAKGILERALRIHPDDAYAHNNLANILINTGNLDAAIIHYRRSLELKPGSAQTYMNIGIAYSELGNVDEAIKHYERGIEIDPNWANPYVNLGVELAKRGRFDAAIENYQRALLLRPELPEAHYNMANAHLLLGNVEQAVRHYRQALESKPDYARAHVKLGLVRSQQGKHDEALAEFRGAVEADPRLPEARFQLAMNLLRRRHLDRALIQFKQTVELAPSLAAAHNQLGTTYQLLGRDREAIPSYREALRLDPSLINTAKRLAWLFSTHPDDMLRDGPEALELAKMVCRAVKYGHAGAIATLATAHAECGNFDEAVTAIERAIIMVQAENHKDTLFQSMLNLFRAGQPYRQPVREPLTNQS